MSGERILVIDDSYVILSSVKERLSKEGYAVTTAAHPRCEIVTLRDLDLILVDYHFGGVVGSEAVGPLRSKAKLAGSEPLFYLYTSDEKEAVNYRHHGFDGVFAVKGDLDALVKQVAAVMRGRQLRRVTVQMASRSL